MSTRKRGERERDLAEVARCALLAGDSSNTAHEVIVETGSGGRVWGASGNECVDFLLGPEPTLRGRAHPEVLAAVEK